MLATQRCSPVRTAVVPGFGFDLITAGEPPLTLADLYETNDLYEALATSGVIFLQGFDADLSDFNDFVHDHSGRITFDAARVTATAYTAEINAGLFEMGLHRENGNLPFVPDLQWFFCLEPARRGSETTFCDGARILYELSAATRKAFEARRIRYVRRIPWANVQRFLGTELGVAPQAITDAHLEQVNATVPGQTYRRLDDHLILSERVTDAIVSSVFSGRKAFCNSLLGPSVNYEPPRITWADGEDIDFEIWDEIKDVTARYTYDHAWRRGDVAIIDNSRVMHGRRRLADPGRRVFGAQSYRKRGGL